MKLTVTAKNMIITPGISNRINKKISSMERYLRSDTEMIMRLRKERNQRICEITVPMNGVTLRSESSCEDNLFMSIDSALAKIERQILRHRTKLEKRLRDDVNLNETPEFIEDPEVYGEGEKTVVREKEYPLRPMSKEDAILQMELLGHSFFVYVDIDTMKTHVLYLRKDGNLGMLVPEA